MVISFVVKSDNFLKGIVVTAKMAKDNNDKLYTYPCSLKGKKFYLLSSVMEQFTKNPLYWSKGRDYFLDGTLLQWIKKNGDDESIITINRILNTIPNKNLAYFHLIYTTASYLDFILFGKKINLKSIELILEKDSSELEKEEQEIIDLLFSQKLTKYSKIYDRLSNNKSLLTRYLMQIDSYVSPIPSPSRSSPT